MFSFYSIFTIIFVSSILIVLYTRKKTEKILKEGKGDFAYLIKCNLVGYLSVVFIMSGYTVFWLLSRERMLEALFVLMLIFCFILILFRIKKS